MRYSIFVTSFLLLFTCQTKSLVVGSNNSVLRQTQTVTFPSADTDNEIRGFTAIDGGFTLKSGGSCLFNALYPVKGTISLQQGELTLQQSLILQQEFQFVDGGTITANARGIELFSKNTIVLPKNPYSVRINSIDVTGSLGDEVDSIDWSYDDAYVAIIANGRLHIYTFDGVTLAECRSIRVDGSASCVRWHPTQYYLLVGGEWSPRYLYLYSFDTETYDITETDHKEIERSCRAVAWNPSGDYCVASSEKKGRELNLYSFSAGSLTEVQKIDTNKREVGHNALSWNSSGEYLAVGFLDDPSLAVYYFDGSTILSSASVTIGANVNAVSYHPSLPYIAVGLADTSQRLRVYEFTSPSTLEEKTSARIDESSEQVLAVAWSPNGEYLSIGRRYASVDMSLYALDQSTVSFSWADDTSGSYNAVNSIRWSHDSNYIGLGDTTDKCSIFSFSPIANTITFNNAHLQLHANTHVNQAVTFEGDNEIDGNNMTIDFGNEGKIQVAENASLSIKNCILKVSGEHVSCLHPTATLQLDTMYCVHIDTWRFANGLLQINNDVTLHGEGMSFVYSSSYPVSILQDSSLLLESGMTFSYVPTTTTTLNLVSFADQTAELHFNGARFYTTVPNGQFEKGVVAINQDTSFSLGASNSVVCGSGHEDDDCTLKVAAGVQFNLASGKFVYNNVRSSSLRLANNQSRLHCASGSEFRVLNDVPLGAGALVLAPGAGVSRKPGKRIKGVIHNEE